LAISYFINLQADFWFDKSYFSPVGFFNTDGIKTCYISQVFRGKIGLTRYAVDGVLLN
jgi:hypothetical protein